MIVLAPGCKRIIVDAGYLQSLGKPNVELQWDAIDSVVEEGILLKTGETVPLDVIIFGTGYSLVRARCLYPGVYLLVTAAARAKRQGNDEPNDTRILR